MPFSKLGLDPVLVKGIKAMGYLEPTAIQSRAIPELLAGRDLLGCAQTGTGKTAAFVLPILQKLKKEQGLRALIVTPTRELAAQVETVVRDCARFTSIRSLAVYGGVPIKAQQSKLRQEVDVLVATPGRLLDLVERGNVKLDKAEFLVLDEGDRMLDMGFLPDIRRILRLLPRRRQTMLFSATLPPDIVHVARDALTAPVTVEVGRRAAPADQIEHFIYPVSASQKTEIVFALLKEYDMESTLIFTRTKHRADRVARQLSRRNVAVARLHSNRTQSQREAALDGFKKGRFSVLVATDIASRGIDVMGISHIINYDVPSHPEDYVHRIGRTGRAQASGTAITLMAPEEAVALQSVERFLGEKVPVRDIEGFNYAPRIMPLPEPKPVSPFARKQRGRRVSAARAARFSVGKR